MLKTENLSVNIGDLEIIKNASIEVGEHEIVSLMGANGAGKTTLVRALSGLEKIKSGSVVFRGKHLEHCDPEEIVKAGIIQIPEGRQLFQLMTVKENLLIGANTDRARAKLKENLEYVYNLFPELEEYSGMAAGDLSGGQQQMVAVGRGIMAEPELLILDEPSIGLSPIMTQRVLKAVRDIHKKGTSVLIAEQNIIDVLEIADRAYILEQGIIRVGGTADEIRKNKEIRSLYLGM